MPSRTEVCNMALSHLGVGREIDDIDADVTAEASACRVFYETAQKRVLRDFDWPFARKVESLGLVTDDGDDDHANDEWGYAYRYPSQCAAFRRIQSGFRNDNRGTQIKYDIMRDTTGQLLMTDLDEAVGVWTHLETDEDKWPPEVLIAFSYLLAYYVAPRVIRDPKSKAKEDCWAAYRAEISQGQANALNELAPDPIAEAEWTRARDGQLADDVSIDSQL